MTARKTLAALLSLAAACGAFAADAPAAPYTFTGHIDLVSRYYLRGATTTYGNALPPPQLAPVRVSVVPRNLPSFL